MSDDALGEIAFLNTEIDRLKEEITLLCVEMAGDDI